MARRPTPKMRLLASLPSHAKHRIPKANKPHRARRMPGLPSFFKRSQEDRWLPVSTRFHKLCKISIESMLTTAKYGIITHQLLSDHIVPAR